MKAFPLKRERHELLHQNWKLDDENLTKEQKEKLRAWIFEYADISSTGEGDIGRTTMAEHIIDIEAPKLIYQRPYRAEHNKGDVAETELNEKLEELN